LFKLKREIFWEKFMEVTQKLSFGIANDFHFSSSSWPGDSSRIVTQKSIKPQKSSKSENRQELGLHVSSQLN
jgi:hypothetical protein